MEALGSGFGSLEHLAFFPTSHFDMLTQIMFMGNLIGLVMQRKKNCGVNEKYFMLH